MSKGFSRREFLRRLSLTGAGLAAGLGLEGQRPAAYAAEARPNILFILTDDQRWDAMSCLGHPFLHTPHMDRLAQDGARLANAFVTTSLCSPSRASFLTGAYAHTHGVRTNEGMAIDAGVPTFPLLLQQAGYETAFLGKWHMQPRANPRPGFDYWLSFAGQGVYNNPRLNENGHNFQTEGYITDLLTDYAVKWLQRRREKPFCLYLSHKAVHGPFTPAERHKNAFPHAQIPQPAGFDDTFEGKPEWIRAAMIRGARPRQMRKNRDKPVPSKIEPGEWNPAVKSRLDYYRCLLAVDEGMGRIFRTLTDLDVMDHTIIVFCSDNGYFMGEHRRGDKRLMYEESIRIPFLVRYPPLVKPGTVIPEIALNIDLAPTLLDLAGVKAPDTVQGRSLRPLLAGQHVQWRHSFLYEYFQEAWLAGIPTMLGVRTESWKYVRYPEIQDLDEMYDLANDPIEMHNLAQDPAHQAKLRELRAELDRLLKQTGYGNPPRTVVKRPGTLVAHYAFDQDEGGTAKDASGKGNDAQITGTKLVPGRRGQAREFSGKDHLEIAKSANLDCSNKPWAVEAWVKCTAADGVILARGGQSYGYALYLQEGMPVFAVRAGGGLFEVRGEKLPQDVWVHLAGVITGTRQLRLYVNGRPVANKELRLFISADPNEAMQIGADLGTKVGDYEDDQGFVGLIDEVSIYDGERTDEQIAQAATGSSDH